jgi:Ribosomal protein L7/L12 dimerisation domain
MKKLILCSIICFLAGGLAGYSGARAQEATREQVMDYLDSLSMDQLAELTQSLESRWGVKASPQPVAK